MKKDLSSHKRSTVRYCKCALKNSQRSQKLETANIVWNKNIVE